VRAWSLYLKQVLPTKYPHFLHETAVVTVYPTHVYTLWHWTPVRVGARSPSPQPVGGAANGTYRYTWSVGKGKVELRWIPIIGRLAKNLSTTGSNFLPTILSSGLAIITGVIGPGPSNHTKTQLFDLVLLSKSLSSGWPYYAHNSNLISSKRFSIPCERRHIYF
jgi:hypothetical protein